ncbi:MAG: hypothetical protein ACTSQY_11525, partial [Candidatus Odinarchaeia archaeon]
MHKNYLTDWNIFFGKYGYAVDNLSLSDVLSHPSIIKNYDLIIFDNGTNTVNGDMLSYSEIRLIAEQGVPILTNGYGGWFILKLANYTNYFSYQSTSRIKVELDKQNLTIYHEPYEIEMFNASSFLFVSVTDLQYNSTFFLDDELPSLDIFANRYSDCAIGQYTGFKDNPWIFFTFIYTPSILNENGERLYINLIEFIINSHSSAGTPIKTLTQITILPNKFNDTPNKYSFTIFLKDNSSNALKNQVILIFLNGVK